MFKLEFTLKQHTPLIHFQHDQDGATLRATEVKPKLDRFIIDKLGGVEKARQEHPEWFSSEKHGALGYKLSITGIDSKVINDEIKNPLYFGNMGTGERKKFVEAKEVEIIVTSFNKQILEEISKHIELFFLSHNFGTRQGKGFGSFELTKFVKFGKEQQLTGPVSLAKTNGIPYLRIDSTNTNDNWLAIDYYYKRLRSGINYKSSGKYEESFLKIHLGAQWEKRWLKEKFFTLTPNATPKQFARVLLGYPIEYRWRAGQGGTFRGGDNVVVNRDTNIKVEHNQIKRFKSPITFKPIAVGRQTYIFILLSEINDSLYGKDFSFSANGPSHILSTPPSSSKLDLGKLVSDYHTHLGASFDAIDFTGRNRVKVSINP